MLLLSPKLRLLWTLLLCSMFPTFLFAQSGPGGIGTNDGNSGLELWLRGNAGVTTSNGNVTGWNDQSGNGRNFSSGSKSPALSSGGINGFDAIDFTGNGDELNDSDGNNYINGLDGFTVLFVIESDQTGVDNGLLDTESPNGTDNVLTMRYDKSGFDGGGTNGIKCGILNDDIKNRIESSSNVQNTNSQLLAFHWNDGNPLELFIDGGSSNNLSNSASPSGTISNANNVIIGKGSQDGSSASWDGLIGEVILFDRQLDKVERIITHNYLSAKYNIALSGNDHYAGDKNGNGDYDQSVIGIGQANGNTHTNSKRDGLQIQTNSGLDNNGEYVMAGHKVQSNSQNTSDLGGVTGLEARWERTWYMDETDNNKNLTVDLTFDLSEGGFPSASAGNAMDYELIHRNAGTGSGSWSSDGTADNVKNGDEIVFNNISITDGDEYTLATTNKNNSPLPVELTHFTVQQEDSRSARLEWATASETNNKHFLVQRRSGDQWQQVGRVEGHGTTTVLRDYRFIDNGLTPGTHYYRLKQVDFDGSYEYSDVKAVTLSRDEASQTSALAVYPNPVGQTLNVAFTGNGGNRLRVTICSAQGQMVYRNEWDTENEALRKALPVSGLQPGAYVLMLKGQNRVYRQRFLKR